MFKELPEGQTHSENDGCGEPEHNKKVNCSSCQFENGEHSFECKEYVEKELSINNTQSKYWNKMVEILDKHFEKGQCKERGAAIVMLSEIEMILQREKSDTPLVTVTHITNNKCIHEYIITTGGKMCKKCGSILSFY